jgi:hypothetical protein
MREAFWRAGIHPGWFGIAQNDAQPGDEVTVRLGDYGHRVPPSAGTHELD